MPRNNASRIGIGGWNFAPWRGEFYPPELCRSWNSSTRAAGSPPFRHASFVAPGFAAPTRKHGVAIVLAGDSEYPQIADATCHGGKQCRGEKAGVGFAKQREHRGGSTILA